MKCKLFKMDGQGFADFLRDPKEYKIDHKKDIPADIVILNVTKIPTDDHTFDDVYLVLFHSEEWDDVPNGEPIPVWTPVKKKD